MKNRKILIIGAIIVVCLVVGCFLLWEQMPAQFPLKKELKLSDFPETFRENTLIVVGDNAPEIEMQATNEIAKYLENKTGNKPLIKKYSEITEQDKRNYNLIVVGTPKTNPFLEEVYAMMNATRVTEEYPGEGEGIVEILPNPWDEEKSLLLIEGNLIFVPKFLRLIEYIDKNYEIVPPKWFKKVGSLVIDNMIRKNMSTLEVYLYFKEKPNVTQIKELKELGVKLDLDYWTPPVGSHPYGFLPAKLPANMLPKVAELNYIKRINSAMREYRVHR